LRILLNSFDKVRIAGLPPLRDIVPQWETASSLSCLTASRVHCTSIRSAEGYRSIRLEPRLGTTPARVRFLRRRHTGTALIPARGRLRVLPIPLKYSVQTVRGRFSSIQTEPPSPLEISSSARMVV